MQRLMTINLSRLSCLTEANLLTLVDVLEIPYTVTQAPADVDADINAIAARLDNLEAFVAGCAELRGFGSLGRIAAMATTLLQPKGTDK